MSGPLSGRTVVVTREQPGELSERLRALGANVVHVPLIEAVEPADGSTALEARARRTSTPTTGWW